MKHLLKLLDLSKEEIMDILNLADQLKYENKNGIEHKILKGKTLGMIFQKSSTRTRVSFETGMYQLGGYPLFLSSNDPKADISLYINSPGGSVSAGLGIYDTIQFVTPDVATICTGMAASMGSVLLCAGTKGKRSALPHSRVMIHQPLGGVQGQAEDILIETRQIEKCRQELCNIISLHCGQSYEKVFADTDRNYWMNTAEAKEYGMIDRILNK